jgi:hypothetical protein
METNVQYVLVIWSAVVLLGALLFFNIKAPKYNSVRIGTFYSALGVTAVAVYAFIRLTFLTF